MTRFPLAVEHNARAVAQADNFRIGGTEVLVTPPLDDTFWILRVPVSQQGQAVVLFPKFGGYGIGFQHEEKGWNTNLPPGCSAEKIRAHIWINRRDAMPKARVLSAIRLLQDEIVRLTGDPRHRPERYPDGTELDYWTAHPRQVSSREDTPTPDPERMTP